MVWLKCKRCGYEWEYKGRKRWYATCPDCNTKVRIAINETSNK